MVDVAYRPAIGSLFSGYGGLDLAVEHVFGGQTVWHSETERAPARLLAHRFPGVPNLGDITRVNWDAVPRVDILAGGFPCQDLSSAGKRAGLAPGTRSGLWAHMAYAIEKLRPRLVVFENVRGLLNAPSAPTPVRPLDRRDLGSDGQGGTRALGTVLGDLAERGYDCRWLGLPASAIGAPHQRFRVFGLAWPRGTDPRGVQPERRRGRRRLPGTRPPALRLPVGGAAAGAEANTLAGRGASSRVDWGRFTPAIRHWERVLGREAPFPIVPVRGRDRLNPEWVEWLMGLESGWVTDVPGISRTMAMKMLGNGVVPAQGATAIRLLLEPISAELEHQFGAHHESTTNDHGSTTRHSQNQSGRTV
ncbi:DNA cytosine methyltransferase [Actinophytocola sp.]|uniref:DNA cytosine methyltransferase n=1 Tax=Actinophytocola sp. TaxID=1872138 RepID=UPI0025C6AF5F|nr:DNA (cytosine-5-)-methyltransferase [Actinophytocola sp.]